MPDPTEVRALAEQLTNPDPIRRQVWEETGIAAHIAIALASYVIALQDAAA